MGMGGGDESGVDRLVIPWREDWQDGYGMNEEVVRGLFGYNFIEAKSWQDLNGRDGAGWLSFERLIIVDRHVAHAYGSLAKAFNKMSMDAFSQPLIPHFFGSTRVRLAHHIHGPALHRPWPGLALSPVPKIVYVDRQGKDETEWNDRRLVTADHEALLAILSQLERQGRARVTRARLGEMDKQEQFATMMDADVILGVHGNGLTHAMWMPEGGVIIELFPPRSFLADYAIVADVLDHQHYVLWNDTVVPRYEWERQTRQGTLDNNLLHNGTHVPLDSTLIATLLDHLLLSMTRSAV
ncbi:hypothetical protein BCR39DRAFT_39486 [Naematelia encephala]|uniref:Glycosyltransferase 61 catalytic domain-containing protein n=1 Tax=Naematelia encephala TaxID=71784 RepID=A0A1Y2BME6_9TREE|nr:hypothetical protein BCR39DRAFT_39486 [Naematelia encephala]